MDLAQFRRFIKLCPQRDLTLPYLSIDGKWLSPMQVLTEIEKNSELGLICLQHLSSTEYDQLEQEAHQYRIKVRLAHYPQNVPIIYTLTKTFTPAEMIEEIEKGTPAGNQFIESERRYHMYLQDLMERV